MLYTLFTQLPSPQPYKTSHGFDSMHGGGSEPRKYIQQVNCRYAQCIWRCVDVSTPSLRSKHPQANNTPKLHHPHHNRLSNAATIHQSQEIKGQPRPGNEIQTLQPLSVSSCRPQRLNLITLHWGALARNYINDNYFHT